MTTASLTAALQACAAGLYPLEAGAELVIAHGAFLHRADFTGRFIEHGTSCGTAMAAIGWAAVIDALNDGRLPCSDLSAACCSWPPASARAFPSTCKTPSPDWTRRTSHA
jgi:hypothetical protein